LKRKRPVSDARRRSVVNLSLTILADAPRTMLKRTILGLSLVSSATPALAEEVGADGLRGFIELRGAAVDGETSWLEHGFGKLRFSGDVGEDNFDTEGFGRGILEWRPQLTWNLDGVLVLQADTQLTPVVDVIEGYLDYRGSPSEGWRFDARAGLFFPPISLEHDEPGWTTTHTLTPSAINSWIGEEVKVLGAEVTARRNFGEEQSLSATFSLFGYNDTSGTLLAFRGWAMGDVMPGVSSRLPLPDRSFPYQDFTRITFELDDLIGYYAQVQYKPMNNVTFDVTHYDNNGDRISDSHGQTDWETRFINLGARIAIDENTVLLAQAMDGQTVWGYLTPMGYWTDVDFASGYVMLAHDFGRHSLAGRLEFFEVSDRSFSAWDNNDEDGWAATAAYGLDITPRLGLMIEGLHIESQRPARVDQGVDPDQEQTSLQTSLRYSF
jgi:hypothetical protein